MPAIGFLAPAGLPSAVVVRVHAEVTKAIAAPEVRTRLQASGFEVAGDTPEEFTTAITRSVAVYRRIVTEAGIKPE